MKKALKKLGPYYNSNYMLQRYFEECYLKAHQALKELTQEELRPLKEFTSWTKRVSNLWYKVRVVKVVQEGPSELRVGDTLTIKALIDLGELQPEEVSVDLYYGPLGLEGELKRRETVPMEYLGEEEGLWAFGISFPVKETGRFGYQIRVTPYHPLLIPTHYLLGRLVTWG
jgi:starch phosphorylase